MRKYVIMGPQGSGKGTQAGLLARGFDLVHISVGDIFRWHVQNRTKLGTRIQRYMNEGRLVPDEMVSDVVKWRLDNHDWRHGFVLDGFPRTLAQAEALDDMLEEIGRELDVILEFQLDENTSIRRMLGRAAEEGRADDTPEVMRKRLELYREMTLPVVEHYRATGKLVGIHADRPIPDVYAEVQQALEQVRSRTVR